MQTTSRLKKAVFYIVMAVLTAAVCFAVLEFVFARFYYSDVYLMSRVQFDPDAGWRLRPGTWKAKPLSSFAKHTISVNSLGLRNPEIAPTKEEGGTRIVLLGDSFTAGFENPAEDIFPVLLEGLLNEGSDRRMEVINAAIPGYGTAQEMMLMKGLAEQGVIGDVYVLVVFPNDLLDNARIVHQDLSVNRAAPGYVLDDNGELVLKHPPEGGGKRFGHKTGAPPKTPDRTRIGRVLKMRISTFLQTRPDLITFANRLGVKVDFPHTPSIILAWYSDDALDTRIPLFRALMRKIKEQADSCDARLLVCLIPSSIQVYTETYDPLLRKALPGLEIIDRWRGDPYRPQETLEKICTELDVPYLDLLPAARARRSEGLYIAGEGHFSKNGHRLAAECLAEFIREHVQ